MDPLLPVSVRISPSFPTKEKPSNLSISMMGEVHEVLRATYALEMIFSFLSPRALCVCARVCTAWHRVVYETRALWAQIRVDECLRMPPAASPLLLQPRFSRLKRIDVPSEFFKYYGIQTNCVKCSLLLPLFSIGNYSGCECATQPPVTITRRGIGDLFTNTHFPELRTLTIHLPFNIGITSASFTPLTTLTDLNIKNNNAYSMEVFVKLLSQNPNLKKLTFLIPPWEKLPPKVLDPLHLEKLEINEVNLNNILHMANTLQSLTVRGCEARDCFQSAERLVKFTALQGLDISSLTTAQVTNAPWIAMHVCSLTTLQSLEVGSIFGMDDFAWMRGMKGLQKLRVFDNRNFSNTIFADFASCSVARQLTTLHLDNCVDALSDPSCLTLFSSLRSLSITRWPPAVGQSPQLVNALTNMTDLVELVLVGLKSFNPVKLYWRLAKLEKLVLNYTPTSDADLVLMSKKLPLLRHVGLVGNYHVTVRGLVALLKSIKLEKLEWDDPSHVKALIAVNSELEVVLPSLPIEKIIH